MGTAALLLLAPATTFWPGAGRAAMSLENYLLIENEIVTVDPDYNLVYVAGVLDTLVATNQAVASAGVNLFCLPNDVILQIEGFKGLIDQHIDQEQKRRSDFRSYAQAATVGIVGLQVLNETFPCADLDVGFQNEGAGTLQAEGGERPEDAADGAGETSETSSSSSSGSAARDLIKGLLGR